MKKIKHGAVLAALISLSTLTHTALSAAAKSFEGVIHYTVQADKNSKGEPAKWKLTVAGSRARWESNGLNGFALLMDGENDEAKVVFDPIQLYVNLDIAEEDDAKDASVPAFTAKKTGKTESILGYLCDEVIITADDKPLHYWFARELKAQQLQLGKDQSRFAKEWTQQYIKEMGANPGYALRLDVVDSDGTQTALEASSVLKKKVPASELSVPDSYSRTTWAALVLGAAKIKKKAAENGENPELITAGDCLKEGAKETAKEAAKGAAVNALKGLFGF